MKTSITKRGSDSQRSALTLVGVHTRRRLTPSAKVLNEAIGGQLTRAMNGSAFDGETVLARNEVLAAALLPPVLARRLPLEGRAIQLPLRSGPIEFSSRAFIVRCHALGMRVDYWTVDDPDVAEQLLESGADGIMTDDPARIAPVFERFRGRRTTPA